MEPKIPAEIVFKTKVRQMLDGDNSHFDYIDYKRKVTRSDCNLKPCQHDYFNSDLFPSMLQRAYYIATEGRDWQRLSKLPACVSIDRSTFLATVTVRIYV